MTKLPLDSWVMWSTAAKSIGLYLIGPRAANDKNNRQLHNNTDRKTRAKPASEVFSFSCIAEIENSKS